MRDYLPMLAKLPIVIAALGWAVRELVLLKRDAKANEADHSQAPDRPSP